MSPDRGFATFRDRYLQVNIVIGGEESVCGIGSSGVRIRTRRILGVPPITKMSIFERRERLRFTDLRAWKNSRIMAARPLGTAKFKFGGIASLGSENQRAEDPTIPASASTIALPKCCISRTSGTYGDSNALQRQSSTLSRMLWSLRLARPAFQSAEKGRG